MMRIKIKNKSRHKLSFSYINRENSWSNLLTQCLKLFLKILNFIGQ